MQWMRYRGWTVVAAVAVCGCEGGGMAETPWPVWGVAFSPDGQFLAAARGVRGNTTSGPPWGGEGEIGVWSVAGWEVEARPAARFTAAAQAVAFAPDGRSLLAVADAYVRDARGNPYDGHVVFSWALPGREPPAALRVESGTGFITAARLSPDGRLIALVRGGAPPVVIDRAGGRVPFALAGHDGNSLGLDFAPDGKALVSVTHVGPRVRKYEVGTGRELAGFTPEGAEPTCICYTPGGTTIVIGAADGSVRLLDDGLAKQVGLIAGPRPGRRVEALAVSPDGSVVAVGTGHAVRLVGLGDGKVRHELGDRDGVVTSVSFSPDGKLLAAGCRGGGGGPAAGGFVDVWDVATGRRVKRLD